jgi:hypothetical protein
LGRLETAVDGDPYIVRYRGAHGAKFLFPFQ